MVTFEQVRNSQKINNYIEQADKVMTAIGFTEHSYAHVMRCAATAGDLLTELGYDDRTAELGRIAGYMHDIGNTVNRASHAQSGAVMAFQLLSEMDMPSEEIACVVSAIGHHDESSAYPVDAVSAALILADKSDVRRSRVRADKSETFDIDIHDRVNYAVEKSSLQLHKEEREIALDLTIDSNISAVMDYFEIFLNRMLLCRHACNFFGLKFRLIINEVNLL